MRRPVRKLLIISFFAILTVPLVPPSIAASEKPNRLRLSYGSISHQASGVYEDPNYFIGANYERRLSLAPQVGLQLDVFKLKEAGESWAGTADFVKHVGWLAIPVGVSYLEPDSRWAMNLGVGLDKSFGKVSTQLFARYHLLIWDRDQFEDPDSVTLTAAVGIGW